VLGPLLSVDVLIIDELGKGRNSDWELTILDQLVTGRYKQNKTIIASTNYLLRGSDEKRHLFNLDLEQPGAARGGFSPLTFESLESRIGKRIYSRLCEMCLFWEINGKDMRRSL